MGSRAPYSLHRAEQEQTATARTPGPGTGRAAPTGWSQPGGRSTGQQTLCLSVLSPHGYGAIWRQALATQP